MSMLRYGVGVALRRSAPAAELSRLLVRGTATVGPALRRSARLSRPPPSAGSFRFKATTGESSNTRQLENRVEDSGVRDAAKVKMESNQALAKFKGRMGSAMEERVADEYKRSTKQIVKEATVVSGRGGGRRKYRNQKEFLDRVVAPISFGFLLLHILITSRRS